VQFRSLHSLARRALAAGSAAALALTLFNAVQPSLRTHKIGPGTVRDVPLRLVPTAGDSGAADNLGSPCSGMDSEGVDDRGSPSSGVDSGGVDSRQHVPSGSARLPLRGAEPGPASVRAASVRAAGAREAARGAAARGVVAVAAAGARKAAPEAPGAGAGAGSVKATPAAGAAAAGRRRLSAPVEVGKARFVGFSWPAPAAGPPAGGAGGKVWLRARTDAGWSGWREVEPAADGPDANTSEYRRSDRVYSDGQWLDAGTEEVQVRVDPPTPPGTTAGPGTPGGTGSGTPGGAGSSAPGAAGSAGPGATARAPRMRLGPAPRGGQGPVPLVGRPPGCPGATGAGGGGPRAGVEAHLITPDMTATPGTEAPQAGVASAATTRPAIISRAGWGRWSRCGGPTPSTAPRSRRR
jgi:hypothetical protein